MDVKRVVYPRDTQPNDGWQAFEPFLRPRPEALAQLAQSFRLGAGRNRFTHYHHGFWLDSLGWILHPQAAGFDNAWVPAFVQQLESFRTKRRSSFRPQRSGGLLPEEAFDAAHSWPAFDQLAGSYRLPPPRAGLREFYHGWLNATGYLTPTLPTTSFDTAWLAGVLQSLGSVRLAEARRKRPGLELLWNSVSRTSGAFTEDVTIWAPALKQLLESFRSGSRRPLDLARLGEWRQQEGWISYAERVFATTIQRPAVDQQLGGFRTQRRVGLSPVYLQWTDPGAWLSQLAQFDPAFWPGIGDLLSVYRSAPGRQLDVRRGDTTLDAWLATEPTFNVPAFAPALAGLATGYRMPARRSTMDLYGSEWQHDMAWLRDVLGLPDPAPRKGNKRRLLVMGVGR